MRYVNNILHKKPFYSFITIFIQKKNGLFLITYAIKRIVPPLEKDRSIALEFKTPYNSKRREHCRSNNIFTFLINTTQINELIHLPIQGLTHNP